MSEDSLKTGISLKSKLYLMPGHKITDIGISLLAYKNTLVVTIHPKQDM